MELKIIISKNCSSCTRLKNEVLNTIEVFDAVKVDFVTTNTKKGKKLVVDNKIKSVPSYVLIDEDGNTSTSVKAVNYNTLIKQICT